MRKEHIACTNLSSYKGLLQQLTTYENVEAVLETFMYRGTHGGQVRLTVDIVFEKGRKWAKIIARNPSALHHIYKGMYDVKIYLTLGIEQNCFTHVSFH